MRNNKWIGTLIYLTILIVGFAWIMGFFGGRNDGLTYSQVAQLFTQEQVRSGELDGDFLTLQLHEALPNGKTDMNALKAYFK